MIFHFRTMFPKGHASWVGVLLGLLFGVTADSSAQTLGTPDSLALPALTIPLAGEWQGGEHLNIQTKLVEKEGRTYLVVVSEPKAGGSVGATSLQVQIGLTRWAKGGPQLVMNALSPAPHDWSLAPFSRGNWHADAVRCAWFDLAPLLAHWRNQESLQDRLQATTLHFDDQTSARAAWRHYASHLAWWAVEVARRDPARLVDLVRPWREKQTRMMKAARRKTRRQARRQARGGL